MKKDFKINTPKKKTSVSISISKIDNNDKLFSIFLNDLSKSFELSKQFNFEKSALRAEFFFGFF